MRAVLRRSSPLSRSRRAGDCAPYLVVMLLLLTWQKVCAQYLPAEDFFNIGAQLYISNNVPAALERVELGRKIYPDDEKLKKLEELLKQQQQQQSQQNQQQQNQQQPQNQKDRQKQPSKSDQQKNQQAPSQSQKDQEKQKPDEQKKADQKKEEAKQQPEEPQKNSPDKKDEEQQNDKGRPLQPGQMTPEEAKKLLDAQKDDERLLQMKPEGQPRDESKPVKDW